MPRLLNWWNPNWLFSLMLWRSLLVSPLKHPLFHKVTPVRRFSRSRTWWQRLLMVGIVVLIILAILAPVLILGTFPFLVLLVFPGALLVLFAVVAGGTSLGTIAAYGVSVRIAQEREHGRYDLLSLAPGGALEWSWAISSRFLRFHPRAWRLRRAIMGFYTTSTAVLILSAIVLILMLLGISRTREFMLSSAAYDDLDIFMVLILNSAMALFLLYVDMVQSTVSAVLIGLAVPTYARSRLDAAFFATALFLALQALVYLLILIGVFGMSGLVFEWIGIESALLLSLVRLAGAAALRELIVYRLWRLVEARLNTSRRELQQTIEGWALR
jgi:hypothetical protein